MSQLLVAYEADDVTLAGTETFGLTDAGGASVTVVMHWWFSKDGAGGRLADVYFQAEVYDPITNRWLLSGHPALDEKWIRAWISGGANPGLDPEFIPEATDPVWLGAGSVLYVSDWVGNTARYLSAQVFPPNRPGVASSNFTWRIVPRVGGVAFPAIVGLPDLGCGVVTGVGDDSAKEWVKARRFTASGTPDDKVNASAGWWLWNGVPMRDLSRQSTLNQTAADGALATGQEYTALITQGASGAPTVTKGNKAAAGLSVPPTPPLNLPGCKVIVPYNASGSAIDDSMITTYAADGRMAPSAGIGLELVIGHGRCLTRGGFVRFNQPRSVALPASLTRHVWLSSDGSLLLTADDVPPVAGAPPIAEATTDGSGVTAVVDKRRLLEPNAQVFHLRRAGLEPSGWYRETTIRQRVTIAASPFTDTTIQIPANAVSLAVESVVKVQPGGTSTMDLGVSGATTRLGAAISTVVGTRHGGLDDAWRFYTSPTAVRITPNTTPTDSAGRVDISITFREYVGPAAGVDKVQVPFRWALDRIVPTLGTASSGGATGSTVCDINLRRAGSASSIFPGQGGTPESRVVIAASDVLGDADPEVTTGEAGDYLELDVDQITDGGVQGQDLDVALVVYPR